MSNAQALAFCETLSVARYCAVHGLPVPQKEREILAKSVGIKESGKSLMRSAGAKPACPQARRVHACDFDKLARQLREARRMLSHS
jgi:hypothetical protein